MVARLKTEALFIKIDRLGRVVIPLPVREKLGLRPGATLRLVQETDKAIYLEPAETADELVHDENGWPVIIGPARGTGESDAKAILKRVHEERADRHAGRKTKA